MIVTISYLCLLFLLGDDTRRPGVESITATCRATIILCQKLRSSKDPGRKLWLLRENSSKRLHEEKLSRVRSFLLDSQNASNFSVVLRERYLRDDVSCGIEGCRECETTNLALPSAGDKLHPSFPNGHFILPDTNVFLSQVS